MSDYPLVSIGIPLYQSKRFIHSIIKNIEGIDYPNTEILVSDRHMRDDAIKLLRSHFSGYKNIRFYEDTDELNWVENHNFLLTRATGKYFRWLPHDDIIPSCSIRAVIEYLESNPETILVYGLTQGIDPNGIKLPDKTRPDTHVLRKGDPWTFDLAMRMNFTGEFDGAFKGVFRVGAIRIKGLSILSTHELIGAERCFLFALALMGRFHYHPEYSYWKIFHLDSVSASWRMQPAHVKSTGWVMFRYLLKLESRPARLFWGTLALIIFSSKKIKILKTVSQQSIKYNIYELLFNDEHEKKLMQRLKTL